MKPTCDCFRRADLGERHLPSCPASKEGDCPFCDAPKWHICNHFVGYVRRDQVYSGFGKRDLRPKRANEVAVNTGVSVRAYRK